MFDLFRSRDKAVRYLLGALLGIVALSMVTYLIPGFGSGDYSESSQVIAKVGDEQVTVREVQMILQNEMRRKSFPPEMMEHYVPLFVNQMIAERALAFQAKRMGFRVTDADVVTTIQSMLPQLFPNGQYVGDEYMAQYLRQMNLTIDQFEANIRKQMLLVKLQNLVLEGIVVSTSEVEEEFRRSKEQASIRYVTLAPGKVREQVSVTPAEMQTYFTANRPQFQIPARRSLVIALVDEAKVGASINLPETELRRLYDQNRDRYRTPERVRARHILVGTTGKTPDEKQKLRAKAEDLLKQIKGGGDFAALAKKNSDDPGSAVKGGELDWYTRGQAVKNFENAAFSLKPNQLSNVVETEFGYHIIQVLQREDARLRPLDEVKGELAAESKRQMVFDRMQTIAEQARGAVAKSPQQAVQIAQQMGLTVVTADKVGAGDPLPQIGVNAELDAALASAEKGAVSPLVQVENNKLAFAVVTDLQPARQAELAEVESQVRTRLIDQKTREVMQQRAKAAEDKLKSGASLEEVAKMFGTEIKTSAPFARDGQVEGVGPAQYFLDAFTKPAGSTIGPINTGEHVVIASVGPKKEADVGQIGENRANIVTSLKSRKARERKELFEDGLIRALEKEGEVKIYDDAIKRLVANYRNS